MKVPVTVAIPVYNGQKYLAEAVCSIINQTVQVKEILVLENSSNDNSLAVAKELKEQYSTWNIHVLQTEETLPYANNWNRALKHAKEKYLVILHHDDLLKPYAIEKQLKFLKEHSELALVGGQEDFIDEKGKITFTRDKKENKIFVKGEVYEFVKETKSYIPCSSVMFDVKKIKSVGFFQEEVLATDELFWPKVLTKFPIAVLGVSLINRRIHFEQTEYKDFQNKKYEIVAWGKEFKKIADYELRSHLQKKTIKIISKKLADGLIFQGATSSFKYLRNKKLAIFFLSNGLKIYPKIIFEKRFWIKITKVFKYGL